ETSAVLTGIPVIAGQIDQFDLLLIIGDVGANQEILHRLPVDANLCGPSMTVREICRGGGTKACRQQSAVHDQIATILQASRDTELRVDLVQRGTLHGPAGGAAVSNGSLALIVAV